MRRGIISLCVILLAGALSQAGNWPGWKGPGGDGVSDEKNPPVSWSKTENVTWKAPLPGGGNSTPIVWDDRVFVTCAKEHGRIRSVICFDRNSGKSLWSGDTQFDGDEPTHGDNPYCAASPITDGKAVFASLGSAGVVAYDLAGKQIWKRDLGALTHIWGNSSSPLFYKQSLILNCGPGLRCFLVALDKRTGKEIWKHDLPGAAGPAKEFKGSWSSPVLAEIDGTPQLIVDLPNDVAGFDPEHGNELWRCRGLSALAYAQPLVGKDVIVAMSGYGGPTIGLRTPKAADRGDITKSHRLWITPSNPQRIGSGVMIGDRVYLLNESGIAVCLLAATGKEVWRGRATGSAWSSTAFVDGKLFSTDQSGESIVWTPGDKLEILNHNSVGERTRASLVFSDGQVFQRTYDNLYCFGKRRGKE
ncbi:MAG TPA: PQQ-binding-like beta-propeller repeat protein [Tepidisphaeraceae bacterium]|nr:PQQ-binding-like beta-propeller repeat protein [Tepidisphaeraceae bacterium]